MSDPYFGEIQIFPINFVPQNWFPCDGRSLSIQQYEPLFAVIGINYGGDGKVSFMLPDLRGQAVLGTGTTPAAQGGITYVINQKVGVNQQSVTLALGNMAPHTHTFQRATTNLLTSKTPTPSPTTTLGRLANNATGTPVYENAGVTTPPNTTLAPTVLSAIGGNASGLAVAHENQQPYLAMTYAICVENGIFPMRP